MFSRIKYQNKSVYLKFILIESKEKLNHYKKRKLIPLQEKNAVKATLCFLHRKTLGFGQLALYHGSILTQQTWMKLIQRLNLNLK